jgi:2-dehydro-3-deoxygalactonokinase
MAYFITVDGGTTNTRVSLVCGESILSTQKLSIGARAGIDDKEPLKQALKKSIAEQLAAASINESDVESILASGMITSELGLYTVAHLPLPAGLAELHRGMVRVDLPSISKIPFCFIPGVRTQGEGFAALDMIRGEETELMGIWNPDCQNAVYVLPGSHSKVIQTNQKGQIVTFSTLLTGELAQSVAQNTILKDAIDLTTEVLDENFLQQGYSYCKECGINKALFKIRILKNLCHASKSEAYSFFMGVILCDEIREILSYPADRIVIGGREQLKNALVLLLKQNSDREVIALSQEEVDRSVIRGMLRVYYAI